MLVHQFEARHEDVQELLRGGGVETSVAEGLNALQLLGDAAFPLLRVPHRDCKVAVYHFIRHHAVYVRNALGGPNILPRYLARHSWSCASLRRKCAIRARTVAKHAAMREASEAEHPIPEDDQNQAA